MTEKNTMYIVKLEELSQGAVVVGNVHLLVDRGGLGHDCEAKPVSKGRGIEHRHEQRVKELETYAGNQFHRRQPWP